MLLVVSRTSAGGDLLGEPEDVLVLAIFAFVVRRFFSEARRGWYWYVGCCALCFFLISSAMSL